MNPALTGRTAEAVDELVTALKSPEALARLPETELLLLVESFFLHVDELDKLSRDHEIGHESSDLARELVDLFRPAFHERCRRIKERFA